jgi:hypothetical protein
MAMEMPYAVKPCEQKPNFRAATTKFSTVTPTLQNALKYRRCKKFRQRAMK